MKKSLIALAIASVVSAPAFAATSNVDIYGVLNLSMNFVDSDAPAPTDNETFNVTSTASRIGFKGTEDLGGGLAAIWQIESGFNADEQSGTLGNRNTFVGLKGGFGTVLMGNHDTPMKMMGRLVDNFGDTLADSRNILGAVASGSNIYDLRTKNTVAYVSPDFSGFTTTVAYVADYAATVPTSLDSQNTDAFSINGIYNNGPLMLGAAYETHNGATSNSNSNMWRIVGGYNFAGFKLAALYEAIDADIVAQNRDAWGIFGSYAMGAWNLKANYMAASESDRVGGNDGADQWTIGADYSLSKRTVVYGYYTQVGNDTFGAYGLGYGAGASDQTAIINTEPQSLGFGVKHSF